MRHRIFKRLSRASDPSPPGPKQNPVNGTSGRAALVRAMAPAVATVAFAPTAAPAGAAITPQADPDKLAEAIVHDAATLDKAGTDWEAYAVANTAPPTDPGDPPTPLPSAVVDSQLGGFPTSPQTFGLLSTGDVTITDTPNDAPDEGRSLEGPPDTDGMSQTDNGDRFGNTDNDTTVLRVAVNVPQGANCVSLDYRFLSDEFPEFVNSEFNDAFIAQIDNLTWTTQDSNILKPGDFATNTGGEPVSVNGVGPIAVSEAEAAGTTFDAATGLVNTKTPITPGPHRIYLSIFDQGDEIFDSVVMLDRLAFISESPSTCRPPEVPVVAPPPPPPPSAPPAQPAAPTPPSNIFRVGSSIRFGATGTATVTVVVPGPGVVMASQAGAARAPRALAAQRDRRKRKPLITRTTVTASKAGPVKLTIRPSKDGKKILRRKGRLKVRVAITFTPQGGAPRTTVKAITLKVKHKRR